jgi:hypothetical protein
MASDSDEREATEDTQSPDKGAAQHPEDDVGEYSIDAVNRLERVMDVQIETLNGIDDKAEHITQLIAVLLGVLFSVLSIGVEADLLDPSAVGLPILIAFSLGVSGLLFSMAAAIITYLSSTFKIGLHQNVGYLLGRRDFSISEPEYYRRVLGTYGYNVERNKQVINTNSRRFRRSLVSLLGGLIYVIIAAALYVGRSTAMENGNTLVSANGAWIFLGGATLLAALVTSYILSGRYLTIQSEESNNE